MHSVHRHWFIGALGGGYLRINSSTLASTAAGGLGAISKKKKMIRERHILVRSRIAFRFFRAGTIAADS